MTALKYKEGGTWKTLTLPAGVHIGPTAPDENVKPIWIDTDETEWPAPTLVTALPTSPVDGQEVYYQNSAMATDGVVWHLRYRAAASGAYKWEFIGGSPLAQSDMTRRSVSFQTTTWGDWSPQLLVTVPLAGNYTVDLVAGAEHNSAAAQWGMGLRINNVDPVIPAVGQTAFIAFQYCSVATGWSNLALDAQLDGLAAGSTIGPRFWQNGGTANCDRQAHSLRVRPVRVG